MKIYIYIAKLRIQTMLAYRIDVWTYTIMQALMMISIGFFWRSVYGEAASAYDVTSESMVVYTLISALMSSLYYMGVEDRISDAVKSGSIATDMIKPVNLFALYLAEDIGVIIINFFRCTIPLFIVGVIFFGLPAPATPIHLLLFFLSFILGYGINWTFSAMFAMLSFSAINLGPAFSIKYHFVNLLSGAVIPIWFFPQWLQIALQCLPFVYMYQTPLSIYIGKYNEAECLGLVGVQAIWLTALTVLFLFAQRKATKRVLVQGG